MAVQAAPSKLRKYGPYVALFVVLATGAVFGVKHLVAPKEEPRKGRSKD